MKYDRNTLSLKFMMITSRHVMSSAMRGHHKLAFSGVSEKQPIYLRNSLAQKFAIIKHDELDYVGARLSQKSHGATYDVSLILHGGSYKSDRTPLLSVSNSPDTRRTRQTTSSKRSATSTGSFTRTTTASSTSRSTRSSCPSAIFSPFIW